MDLLEQLVGLLERGGPWTVAALCIFVSNRFYAEMRAAQATAAAEKQQLNDRLIRMTEQQVAVLTVNNDNQKQLIDAIKLLEG